MKVKYHKITIRSMRRNKYLVLREKGSHFTYDDGRATAFKSIENALEYIRANLPSKDRYQYHVTAFYTDKEGFLAWHYHYI